MSNDVKTESSLYGFGSWYRHGSKVVCTTRKPHVGRSPPGISIDTGTIAVLDDSDAHIITWSAEVEGWTNFMVSEEKESVDHPAHYGGKNDPYEAIKVITAWRLGFNLGNTVKYISRAGKKDPAKLLEDLKKARFYLDYEIQEQERQCEERTTNLLPF